MKSHPSTQGVEIGAILAPMPGRHSRRKSEVSLLFPAPLPDLSMTSPRVTCSPRVRGRKAPDSICLDSNTPYVDNAGSFQRVLRQGRLKLKLCSFISIWVLLFTAALFPSSAAAGLVSGPGWNIAGVADFNGDGCRDILWRNQTTGDMAVWYMHGSTLAAEQKFESSPDSTWDVVGVGDFNGDGSPDILLSNKSTGDVRIWYLNGSAVMGQDTVAGLGNPWNIAGVGDFNGDGSPDILWRNPQTGETIVWFMKGRLRLGTETLEALPPPWNIIEIGDFGGDGSPDILWKNSATGDVVVWYMRGLAHLDPGAIAVRAPPLDIVGVCSLDDDVNPDIIRRHIATLSDSCSRLAVGLPGSIVISSPCIRAPPIFAVCS